MFETVAEREGFSRCEKRDARTCWQEGSSMVCCTRRAWKGKSRVQHPAVKPLDLQNEPAWTKRTNGRLPPAVVLNECNRLITTGSVAFSLSPPVSVSRSLVHRYSF